MTMAHMASQLSSLLEPRSLKIKPRKELKLSIFYKAGDLASINNDQNFILSENYYKICTGDSDGRG